MSWHDLGFHGRYDGARTGQCSTRYAHVSCMPCMPVYYRGGVFKLRYRSGCVSRVVYTTAACLPHAPCPGKVGAGVCWHGLGLSWKVSWSTDGPVLQEIRVCLVHRPVDDSFCSEVHHRQKN